MRRLQANAVFTEGAVIAPAVIVHEQQLQAVHSRTAVPEEEKEKLRGAFERAVGELRQLSTQSEIFAAHLELIEDPTLYEEIQSLIDADARNAAWATEEVIKQYAQVFEAMEDPYFRERAADMLDIGKRLLLALEGGSDCRFNGIDRRVILVAKELTPSDTAKLPLEHIAGFLTEEGGVTGNVAIMAKGLGIPALVGVSGLLSTVEHGQTLAFDAATGEVLCAPDKDSILRYTALVNRQQEEAAALACAARLRSITSDGVSVAIFGNAGSLNEVHHVFANGASGIGLFQTEFLYMSSDRFPDEEEQFSVYRQAAEAAGNRELIIRTLDIGGDKALPYFKFPKEDNPFLGCRAIRFCLLHPDIFKPQLRALLRAAVYGNLKIMYPMIADVDELEHANTLLNECKAELQSEGIPFRADIPVGMMIETPAAVLAANHFAERVDFFSIGTNDLTQYLLAADRGNPALATLYSPLRPSVISAIAMVIQAAHRAQISVGMCGEFAGDTQALALLLGLGLDEFSVPAAKIPQIKLALQKVSYAESKALAVKVLRCETLTEVQTLLNR